MTANQERWAEALAIEQMHGPGACAWVAGRIGDLVMKGDVAGIARFKAIAEKLDALRVGSRQ